MLAYLALGCFQQNGWLLAQAGCEETFSGNDGEVGKNQKAYQAFLLGSSLSFSFLHGGQHETTVSFEEACWAGTAAVLGDSLDWLGSLCRRGS